VITRRLRWGLGAVAVAAVAVLLAAVVPNRVAEPEPSPPDGQVEEAPDPSGYFQTSPPGAWASLPGDSDCAARVHRSSWEPRPANYTPNNTMPPKAEVQQALASRPRAAAAGYDSRWDGWLLPRVTGQHTGTTDENIQWAACKWGISDNLLRAIAVRESTWVQYSVYPSGRCVEQFGCGDMVPEPSPATEVYCTAISQFGYDYRRDYPPGICPETFGIAGVMSWEAPEWGPMADNQNGTFPFNRDSTAYALDYLGSYLRGCQEGWLYWLGDQGGDYGPGDIWGCVGSWYSGDWKGDNALKYIRNVRTELDRRTWLTPAFRRFEPPCSGDLGCPAGF
jgi:hypothetical protein